MQGMKTSIPKIGKVVKLKNLQLLKQQGAKTRPTITEAIKDAQLHTLDNEITDFAIVLYNKETRRTVTWADFEFDTDLLFALRILETRYL